MDAAALDVKHLNVGQRILLDHRGSGTMMFLDAYNFWCHVSA
jgi:hypothetical protein